MYKTFVAMLAFGAVIAGIQAASAQTSSTQTPDSSAQTTTTTAPATPKIFAVATSTIGELLDNPAAKAVLQKYLPNVVASPQIDMGRSMTLPQIAPFDPSVTPDKLSAIDAELKALPPQ